MDNESIKDILRREAEAVLNIPVTDAFNQAVELLFSNVHNRNGKIIMSGMGKAGQIAVNMATTFCSTGSPAIFLHPAEAQHGDLGVIQPNDILVLISNSGKTREIVEIVQLAKNLYEQLPIIVITGNPDSQLAQVANVVLATGNPKEVCALGLTPTTSTTVMTVIGDILVVSLMKKIGFTSQDYAKRHHGGYLGNKSRQQAKDEVSNQQ
ncbi:MAG: SIS domain-containing protein [Bacteroidales bacterium]|nr:SIS domain-containing protein [Bacteroidales bacterium]MDD7725444.1 SIS domain-containing protein [Bacteroidales bacterium]MDY4175040.1 SIS domain-containing protein [Bacteroidales bacterium]